MKRVEVKETIVPEPTETEVVITPGFQVFFAIAAILLVVVLIKSKKK